MQSPTQGGGAGGSFECAWGGHMPSHEQGGGRRALPAAAGWEGGDGKWVIKGPGQGPRGLYLEVWVKS